MLEATWGADPLEHYGGFPNLQFNQSASYRSSLAPNATVTWSETQLKPSHCTETISQAILAVGFPHIDWSFMQSIYGWAALQYQAWVRGTLTVRGHGTQPVSLWTEYLLEFYVDGVHYFGGDYYGYGNVPLVLHLEPGEHTLDLRLVRDVRSMGGLGDPLIDVTLTGEVTTDNLQLATHSALLPDMVNGRLAGALGSVTVRNNGLQDAHVTGISSNDSAYFTWLAQPSSARVIPGQTRPIAFVISCQSDCSPNIQIQVEYTQSDTDLSILELAHTFSERSIHEPHKRTFLHPGGMVSYAILRPPPTNVTCPAGLENKLPILLQLHGAGLEADDNLVMHALDPVPDLCAWALFPTGSTPWSGDDWHTWGFADVEAAVDSLPVWLELVNWDGPGIDTSRWLVSGHSNGGQGTWYALTHRPDKVIAAVPVSGYSSIQNYVPYDLWQPMDPSIRALLDSSMSSYRHERLLANAQHIAVLQQHGTIDDNVPAFHSRLMNQLIHQAGADSTYIELEAKNHWFDGVMTTEPLSSFYERVLNGVRSSVNSPSNFSFFVANPADMGPRHGISVLHLSKQGRLGKVVVEFAPTKAECYIKTSNILSMKLSAIYPRTRNIKIDSQSLHLPPLSDDVNLWLASDGMWRVSIQPCYSYPGSLTPTTDSPC